MYNPYLSDNCILTSGDKAMIDGAADDIFAAVFTLLDQEHGGDIAGRVADRAARAARRILTSEYEVFDSLAATV